MPLSMTGFGGARRQGDGREYTVEVRSVNHRYCDVRCHVPAELARLGPDLEAAVRKRVNRGRVDVTVAVGYAEGAVAPPKVDLARARGYKIALEQLAEALDLEVPSDLTHIAQAPGVIRFDAGGGEAAPSEVVRPALDEALDGLRAMRAAEGHALTEQLLGHLDTVEGLVDRVRSAVPRANAERRRKLDERIRQLIDDAKLEPGRLAQEAAILADRADVTEELERLQSHIAQFAQLLKRDDPIGRKLDFLVQEMNREANTIGSKCSDAELAHVVVDLKTELERIREQVQNLE